jgi:guanylate kinase
MAYTAVVVETDLQGAVDTVAKECPEAYAIFLRSAEWKYTMAFNAGMLAGATVETINTALMAMVITAIQFGLDYSARHGAPRQDEGPA